jgi:predicted transcriptional regulator
MIDALITSKTRIKLITRLFLNSNAKSHLRGLAGEFCESSNAIRLELNRFEKAGLLTTSQDGNKKIFQANTQHPLYHDIHSILLKHFASTRSYSRSSRDWVISGEFTLPAITPMERIPE